VTSRASHSETNDNVYVSLTSDKFGVWTEERWLRDTDKSLFERGAADEFDFYDFDIGNLLCVAVRYSTGGDRWKLDHIEVEIGDDEDSTLYKTKSVEQWFDKDHSFEQFCDLTIDDPCKCNSVINDNWELTDITYDTDRATVDKMDPAILTTQDVNNQGSDAAQSTQFQRSESFEESASFEHTRGAEISVGTMFKVGIPFVGETEVSATLTGSYGYTNGKSETTTKTIQATFNCIAPPRTSVRCTALLQKYIAIVNYTQTWTHKVKKCDCTTSGVFTKKGANNMSLQIDGTDAKDGVVESETTGGLDDIDGKVDTVPNVRESSG